MKRVGIFSGRVYDEKDFTDFMIKECCYLVTDEEIGTLECLAKWTKRHERCEGCSGCPVARREERKNAL